MESPEYYLRRYFKEDYNLIYYSSASKDENQSYYELDINEMYKEKYYIKLESWGDFQVAIYKLTVPDRIVDKFLNGEGEWELEHYYWRQREIDYYKNEEDEYEESLERAILDNEEINNLYKYLKSSPSSLIAKREINFKLFCKSFLRATIFTKNSGNNENNIVFDGEKFRYLHKNSWCVEPLKDSNFKDIQPYKVLFNKLFDKTWSDVLRHKCVYANGNINTHIIEFDNNYYMIDVISS